MRSKQLWNVIRGAAGDGTLRESLREELERGDLVDITLLAPPPITLGAHLRLPCGRTADYCVDRFFESAKNQNISLTTTSTIGGSTNVLASDGALHHMLLQPDALGWFTSAFWAVLLCEFHLESPHVSPQYVGALFLNMSLFLVRILQGFPKLSNGAPLGLLDMVTAVAGAIVHTIHLVSNAEKLPARATNGTLGRSVERNLVWWVLGIDGVEAAKGRAAPGVAYRAAQSVPNAPPSPGRSVTEVVKERHSDVGVGGVRSALSLQQQRLQTFEAKLDAMTAAHEALGSSTRCARSIRGQRGTSSSTKRHESPSDAQKPLLSRSVALKRSGGEGESGADAGGGGPRATFDEIHQRVQLTREARRDVLDREAIAMQQAKARAQRERDAAELYALEHQITGETWSGPARYAVRSFQLDAVSPLVKFFLLATAEHSTELVFPHDASSASDGQRGEVVSAFQRISASAISQTSAAFGVPERRYRLPRCPDCKSELVRAKSITATCGRCSRPAASTSSATLQCDGCAIGYVCRGCAIPGGVTTTRTQQRVGTASVSPSSLVLEPRMLFGEDISEAQWSCYQHEASSSRPSSALSTSASHRARPSAAHRVLPSTRLSGTAHRWSALIQELLGAHRANTTPEEATFQLYLREANHNIAIDAKVEVRRALEEAASAMLNAGGVDHGSEDVMRSKGSVGGPPVLPSAPKALAHRPASAQGARALSAEFREDLPPSDFGAFMTGVPTSHGPRDALTAATLLSRPMTPLRRPSSALASRPTSAHRSTPQSGGTSASAATPTALQSIRIHQRPASALSRSSALAFAQSRPASTAAPMSWTTVAPKECAALDRFRKEAKDTMAGCVRRVSAINAECRATEEASTAAARVYKANVSRYAVEHLQEVQRAMKAIDKSERAEARRSMAAVTSAIEAAAGVFHQPLRHMDAIKDALYTIDQHFNELPESFRMFALRYSSETSAALASMVRDYKMTQRDQSQWPASLDDARCSRSREVEKYGAGSVYVSPARRGSRWQQVSTQASERDIALIGADAELAHFEYLVGPDEGVEGSPVDVTALLRSVSLATVEPSAIGVRSPPLSAPNFSEDRDANAPPSCMPATSVPGSDTLVLRSGVMVWDDTQRVVGKRAGDVRMKYLDKQRVTPNDARLQIQVVL